MNFKVALAITAMFACIVGAEAATASSPPLPVAWESNTWRSPLGYTYCIYNGRTVRCMTTSGKTFGFTLVIGKRRAWQGDYDSVPCPACGTLSYPAKRMRVLPWGRYYDAGPYRCTSRRVGMICVNRRNGHGFHLSLTRHAETW
jgi:hypothetical protein